MQAINIGNRRELFRNDYLIAETDAQIVQHSPEYREDVFTCDRAWEGNAGGYFPCFSMKANSACLPEELHKGLHCYVSADGIHFTYKGLISKAGYAGQSSMFSEIRFLICKNSKNGAALVDCTVSLLLSVFDFFKIFF